MKITRFFLFVMVIFVTACGLDTQEVVVDTWPNGTPMTINHYFIDGVDSLLLKQVAYYESGKKRREGDFADGCRDGRWRYWYEDGTLWEEGYYHKGARSGAVKFYHPNGVKKSEGYYENGIRTGVWKFWNEQGRELKVIDYDQR
jgi:antitoxin component YwqK of YwqJK toxin-antitoxin module